MNVNYQKWQAPGISSEEIDSIFLKSSMRLQKKRVRRKVAMSSLAAVLLLSLGFGGYELYFSSHNGVDLAELLRNDIERRTGDVFATRSVRHDRRYEGDCYGKND